MAPDLRGEPRRVSNRPTTAEPTDQTGQARGETPPGPSPQELDSNRGSRTGGDVKRATVGNGDSLTVKLFVRGSSPVPLRGSDVIDTLEKLSDRGLIGAVDVHSWPASVSLVAKGGSTVAETFRTFRAWADEHETTICPPFVIRDIRSTITGDGDTVLITPVLCLAVYAGEELLGVYPCCHGDSVMTVDDCLDQLSTDGIPASTVLADKLRENTEPT